MFNAGKKTKQELVTSFNNYYKNNETLLGIVGINSKTNTNQEEFIEIDNINFSFNNLVKARIMCNDHNTIGEVEVKNIRILDCSNGCDTCKHWKKAIKSPLTQNAFMKKEDLIKKSKNHQINKCQNRNNNKKCTHNCKNKYEYVHVPNRTYNDVEITLKCVKHNCEFKQSVKNHFQNNDNDCPECANKNRIVNAVATKQGKINSKNFPDKFKNKSEKEKKEELDKINKLIKRENIDFKENYTCEGVYRRNCKDYYIIKCKKHENKYEIYKSDLLTNRSGCIECRSTSSFDYEKFVNAVDKKYGKNKYKIPKIEGLIIKSKKITIICPKENHGEFEMKPSEFLLKNKKYGCPKCYQKKCYGNTKKFIKKAKKVHGNKYNYDLVKYENSKKHVKIYCSKKTRNGKEHGIFRQRPTDHITGKGRGCPTCNNSKGEQRCAEILEKLGIEYTPQAKLKDMVHKSQLSLDFYFEKDGKKFAIEFNGEQHYKNIKAFDKEKLKNTYERDVQKENYCKKNNINLLCIPYFMYERCDELIGILINEDEKELEFIQKLEKICRQNYICSETVLDLSD